MFALLIAQAVVYVPPAPIPPAPPRSWGSSDQSRGPRTRIGVVVRGGGAVLWDGSLWVAAKGTSSWRQTVQEPVAPECPAQTWDTEQNEISVQFQSGYRSEATPATMSVSVRWVRPGDQQCGGSRTVELRQSVMLDEHTPVVLRGDGGLTVELRRR